MGLDHIEYGNNDSLTRLAEAPGQLLHSLEARRLHLPSIVSSGLLSRETLREKGFILVPEYDLSQLPPDIAPRRQLGQSATATQGLTSEEIDAENSCTQMLHHDSKGKPIDVIALHYAGGTHRRGLSTVLATENDQLFSEVVHFLSQPSVLQRLDSRVKGVKSALGIQELREAVRTLDITELAQAVPSMDLENWEDLDWRTFLFNRGSTMLRGTPALDDLYAFLESADLLYRHEWKKNDLLIVDNAKMLHARAASAVHPNLPNANRTNITRQIFNWTEDNMLIAA